MSVNRYLLPLAALALLLGVFAVGLTLNPREIPSPLINKPVPAFALAQLGNPEQTVGTADFMGRVTLFNVFASWCVACRAEHPLLMELAKAGTVEIMGLNYKDTREDGLRWLAQFGNPYDVIAHDLDGRVGIEWGVYGVPETFVVDRLGVIRYKHIGPISPRDLDETILPLVRQLQQNKAG